MPEKQAAEILRLVLFICHTHTPRTLAFRVSEFAMPEFCAFGTRPPVSPVPRRRLPMPRPAALAVRLPRVVPEHVAIRIWVLRPFSVIIIDDQESLVIAGRGQRQLAGTKRPRALIFAIYPCGLGNID